MRFHIRCLSSGKNKCECETFFENRSKSDETQSCVPNASIIFMCVKNVKNARKQRIRHVFADNKSSQQRRSTEILIRLKLYFRRHLIENDANRRRIIIQYTPLIPLCGIMLGQRTLSGANPIFRVTRLQKRMGKILLSLKNR